MINVSHYSSWVLSPTLRALDMHSSDAMFLMMRTAATESRLTHLYQLPFGPALGFFQVEAKTVRDIYRYLDRRQDIKIKLLTYLEYDRLPDSIETFVHNLAFNAAMARIKYWMIPGKVPKWSDVDGQAYYWKKHYNTVYGSGKIEDFIEASRLVDGAINVTVD